MHILEGDDLYAKVRYNIHHGNTDMRWRLFLVGGGINEEIMLLCRHINIYVCGQTYAEIIDGVGHYSILYKASKVTLDDNLVAWIQ